MGWRNTNILFLKGNAVAVQGISAPFFRLLRQ
jgi:hypothetical protein